MFFTCPSRNPSLRPMSRTRPVCVLLAMALPLFVLVAACDSGGSNEEQIDHAFTLDISPVSLDDASRTSSAFAPNEQYLTGTEEDTLLDGYSFFHNPAAVQSEVEGDPFQLYLNENETLEERRNQEGLLGFAYSKGGLPTSGRDYPFESLSSEAFQNGEAFKFVLYYDYQEYLGGDIDTLTYFDSIGGTITFSTSTSREVAGRVDGYAEAIRIVNVDSTSGYNIFRDTVEVSGDFRARNADTFLPTPDGSPRPYPN